jgi:uncharacterized protein YjeT (DUF2065 family)
MSDLATAAALVLVIEGVVYALFPGQMQRMMAAALTFPPGALRTSGLVAAALGVGLVWLIRS